jgi:predicted transcriptional regulator
VRKRILQRVADGRRFLYTAKVDRSTLLHTLVAALLKSLRDDTDSDIVAALMDELSEWPDLGSAV